LRHEQNNINRASERMERESREYKKEKSRERERERQWKIDLSSM